MSMDSGNRIFEIHMEAGSAVIIATTPEEALDILSQKEGHPFLSRKAKPSNFREVDMKIKSVILYSPRR